MTAFYELVPVGVPISVPGVDPLKYQQPTRPAEVPHTGELLTLRLRYKQPDSDQSSLVEVPLRDDARAFRAASDDFRFAAAVAAFGMTLRDSPHRGDADLAKVLEWARPSVGEDKGGLRAEFVQLVEKARSLRAQ